MLHRRCYAEFSDPPELRQVRVPDGTVEVIQPDGTVVTLETEGTSSHVAL